MPITTIMILTVIVTAFVVFAVALEWGERQTRNLGRENRQRAASNTNVAILKRSAEVAAANSELKNKAPDTAARA